MNQIPSHFRATGTDIAISITRAVTQHRIGLRLAFDCPLDAERLARAVTLSLDAEPILGCSFDIHGRHAVWRRVPELDGASAFVISKTTDPEGLMDAFQAEEVSDAGPQAFVALFRTPDADHLGIKVSHVVGDGQSAKQYAYLLAEIYTRLGVEPQYTPEPNLANRPSGRDVWNHLDAGQKHSARKAKSWTNPTWEMPSTGRSGRDLTFRARTVGPDRFLAMKVHANSHGATVNDMMLAAVLRACIKEFDPPTGVPLSLMCTADLRRYLPEAERLPISNVSISGSLDIERVDNEDFDATLGRVRQRMAVWAEQCYGAGPAVNAERLTGLGYKTTKVLLEATFKMAGSTGKTYPWFTNIGLIDRDRLHFDGVAPTSGHVFGPVAFGASIVPVISTYRDTLTVCMGFCASDCDAAVVERVLIGALNELPA